MGDNPEIILLLNLKLSLICAIYYNIILFRIKKNKIQTPYLHTKYFSFHKNIFLQISMIMMCLVISIFTEGVFMFEGRKQDSYYRSILFAILPLAKCKIFCIGCIRNFANYKKKTDIVLFINFNKIAMQGVIAMYILSCQFYNKSPLYYY